jgi:anti-sigma factor RsiW
MNDATLMAFADGRLSPAQSAEVLRYLADHPQKAEEVALWRRQNEAIVALHPPVAAAGLPERLSPHKIASRLSQRTDWRKMAAAAVLLLGLGAGAGWSGHAYLNAEETPSEALVKNAMIAHALYVLEARHAVEVAASEEEHLVTWLSKRIARPIDAPDLAAQGFTLVGGRLLPPDAYAKAGPVAQLMYENANADRVTVYVTAALGEPDGGDRFVEEEGLNAFYWSNDQITCTVVASLPPEQMKAVAGQIYRHLSARNGSTYRG